jgi:hypothetical protein
MRRVASSPFLVLALASSLGLLLLTGQTRAYSEKADLTYKFEDIAHYDARQEYVPNPKWGRLLSPGEAGWSPEKLNAVKAYAESAKTDALLVIFNGLVILDYGRYEKRLDLHSVRKSLMSVMFGIYHDMGLIDLSKTLGELGIDDIGGLTEAEKSATVEDLLTSRSGVYHTAAYETKGMVEWRPDRGAYQAREHWFYNNWDFNALATIFNKTNREDFFSAFASKIAVPLEMEQFRLEDTLLL